MSCLGLPCASLRTVLLKFNQVLVYLKKNPMEGDGAIIIAVSYYHAKWF
jgi:hypothetical protein